MRIDTFTERHWRPEGKLYWFSAMSFKREDGWCNCLYIHFFKDDFPWLNSPPLVDSSWTKSKKRFEYSNCNVAELDWHWGITFYEEISNPEHGRTKVKAGADYQHLHDDDYRSQDSGELILKNDAIFLAKQFDAMNERLSKR